jgi:CCR4-NOT transcription complex subunit 1
MQVRAADPGLVQHLETLVQQSGGAAQAGTTAVAAVANAALASDGDLASLNSQQQQQQSTSGPDISGIRGMFDNQPAPSTKHTSFSGLRLSNGSVGGGDAGGPSAAAAGGSGGAAGASASSTQQQKTSTNGPTGAAAGRGQQAAPGSVRGKAGDVAAHQSVGSERGDEAAVADLLSDSTAAQATANMALNEKPAEKLSLHMTTNNETLELAERSRPCGKPPSDAASDKVSFIMNNLSQQNVEVKARDLAHLVVPHHVDWFANYLVVKRAAQVGGLGRARWGTGGGCLYVGWEVDWAGRNHMLSGCLCEVGSWNHQVFLSAEYCINQIWVR